LLLRNISIITYKRVCVKKEEILMLRVMHLIIFKIRAHLTIVGEERRLQSYLMANKGNATTTFHKPIRRHALKGLLRK